MPATNNVASPAYWLAAPAFDRFMQMPLRQSALRQVPIDRRDAERQHGTLLTPMPFDALQVAAQLGNSRRLAGATPSAGPLSVRLMFLFCSHCRQSQMDSSTH